MHNSSRLDHFQPRSIQEITNLACSVETRGAPSRMAKCASDASIEDPEAPATELANNNPSSPLQHASHFGDHSLVVTNETQDSHGHDEVERFVVERQALRPSLHEAERRALVFEASPRGGDHRGVCIKPGYDCATPCELRCERSVAAADIEQRQASNGAEKFKKQLLLKSVGDLSEAA